MSNAPLRDRRTRLPRRARHPASHGCVRVSNAAMAGSGPKASRRSARRWSIEPRFQAAAFPRPTIRVKTAVVTSTLALSGNDRRVPVTVRNRICIAAAAGMLAIGGCSSGGGKPICAADSGARACLVPKSSSHAYEVEATGFLPNSDVRVTREGQSGGPNPSGQPQLHIGADGTSLHGGGQFGLLGVTGPVTFTLAGTAATGTAVVLSLVVGR